MSSNEFQGISYETRADMLDTIAEAYITGGGMWDENAYRVLAENTDSDLAAECVTDWGLAERLEDGRSHMQENEYTQDDLAEAIARYREAEHRAGEEK